MIEDKRVLEALADLVIDRMWNSGLKYAGNSVGRMVIRAMYGNEFAKQVEHYYRTFKLRKQTGDPIRVLWNAPTLILVTGLRKNALTFTNAALAARNIEIMALTMGLGTCWAGFLVVTAARSRRSLSFCTCLPSVTSSGPSWLAIRSITTRRLYRPGYGPWSGCKESGPSDRAKLSHRGRQLSVHLVGPVEGRKISVLMESDGRPI